MSETIGDRIRAAFDRVHRLASKQTTESYMSIPVDEENDADCIVINGIKELELLAEKAEAERDELAKALRATTARLGERAEKAERERDEARAAICPTRVNGECTALADQISATEAAEQTIESIEALKERWRESGEEGESWMADELEAVLKEVKG